MQLAPPDLHLARHARLRDDVRATSLDALVVTSLPNIAYLTGLFASAGALVLGVDRLVLVVDGRYLSWARARAEALPGMELAAVTPAGTIDETVAAVLCATVNRRAGFEAEHMTVQRHQDLLQRLVAAKATFDMVPTRAMVEARRAVKDSWELHALSDGAARLSDAAKCIIPKALAGRRECDVAAEIDAELRRVGFQKPAFDTIVAAGPNSAVPHYRAGERVLARGDLVILDFGGMLNGYAVDLTRTIIVGHAGPRERRLLEQVAAAQQAAFDAIAIGRDAADVDTAARTLLEREGLGDAFSHGTGHGLGLEVHERPRVTRRRVGVSAEPLQAGMVFTLEPGAYLEGWGGARIEDDVAITAKGPEWLTDVPRIL